MATNCESALRAPAASRCLFFGLPASSAANAAPAGSPAPQAPGADSAAAVPAAQIARDIEEADIVKQTADKIYVLNPFKGLIIVDVVTAVRQELGTDG